MSPTARAVFTSTADGDLAVDNPEPELLARRRAVIDLPWTWLRQRHGARVVTVARPGAGAGAEADAAVTAVPGAALAVHAADCAPIALTADGVVGVAHAGWKGLAAGVVEAVVDAMRALGAGEVGAQIGPTIRPQCYAFGAAELDQVATRCGPAVRSTTASGAPGLDLVAGIRAELTRCGVTDIDDGGTCTACSPSHWSYRARGDAGRHAVVAWLAP